MLCFDGLSQKGGRLGRWVRPLTSYGCPGAGRALNLACRCIFASSRPLAWAGPPGRGPGDITTRLRGCPSSEPQKAVGAVDRLQPAGQGCFLSSFWVRARLGAFPGGPHREGSLSGSLPHTFAGNISSFVTWLNSRLCGPPAPQDSPLSLRLHSPGEQRWLCITPCAFIHAPRECFAQKRIWRSGK